MLSLEQCGQQNIVHYCFHQLGTSCPFYACSFGSLRLFNNLPQRLKGMSYALVCSQNTEQSHIMYHNKIQFSYLGWVVVDLTTVPLKTKLLVHLWSVWTMPTALKSINLVNCNFIEMIPMLMCSGFFRIPEDCNCHCHWFCYYGFHWLLCKTYPHSNQ